MELRQMRYVVAVAETRNFTRAAKQCFVSQSTLSQQIKALEHELGVALFARTSRRVELTASGEAFVATAGRCLELAERAAAEAAGAAGELRGTLSIGTIPTDTAIDLPAALQHFRQLHPQVRVSLRIGASDELAAKVAAGALDLAVLGLPVTERPQAVDYRELQRQRLVAVLPPTYDLTGRTELALSELSTSTFADFPSGSPGRSQSDQAFAAAGLQRDVAFEVSSPELMIDLVARGLAVAMLPAPIAARSRKVQTAPVVLGPERVEYLVWSNFNASPAARVFLDTLQTPQPADDASARSEIPNRAH